MVKQLLSVSRGKIMQLLLFVPVFFIPALAYGQPGFSLEFSPSTIGPGSIATLQFTINNIELPLATELSFTDTLPDGVTIAAPAQARSECGGTLDAPEGGSIITFSGGTVAGSASCTLQVDIISATAGTHTNVTGDLTSTAGNSGTATGDLTVALDRPGFSKKFSPTSISLGGRSTLTFTIDNSANTNTAASLQFTDNFPVGLVVANPANASTTCTGGTITAVPGASVVSYGGFDSIVGAQASCSVTVDVTVAAIGLLGNTTGDLTSTYLTSKSSGKAGAVLEVTAGKIHLDKTFLDNPVSAGGTTKLAFTLSNFDRVLSATNISFTDDLDASLSGLAAVGLPLTEPCGPGSQLSGTNLLTLTGASLAPEETCAFEVILQVPVATDTAAYPNVTSAVTAELDGQSAEFPGAADILFVNEAPVLTKKFLTNPVGAGGTTTLEFTITSISPISGATSIAFIDELTTFLPFPVSVILPPTPDPPCGDGSALTLVSVGANLQALSFTGGSLAASGQAGDSCTFTVDIDIPGGVPSGIYLNVTEPITAIVGDFPQTGAVAFDTLTVAGSPTLSKAFTNDPVLPGDTVTLQFTLSNAGEVSGDATSISFTDDLDAALSGLVATGLPIYDICGVGSSLSGTSLLSFNGGGLAAGASCTFSVTLQVPADSISGKYTNTTSSVAAMVAGISVLADPAQDDLQISGLSVTKSFTDDPVIPGDTVTLEFILTNQLTTQSITGITFSDNLAAALANLAATGLPMNDICGTGSTITGTSSLSFTGGNLGPQESCTFSISLQVPQNAASGTYVNTTGSIVASVDGNPFVLDPVTADLVVNGDFLQLSKSFIDDPAIPGETVILEFILTNLHTSQSATGLAFTDDLDAALAGLAATGLPAAACGGTLSGTGQLDFTGGFLAADASCTFSVELQVPTGLPSGTTAINTTSQVTGIINGLEVTGTPASDVLKVSDLILAKSFSGKGRAGEMVTLSFTLQNNNLTETATDLRFSDELDTMLPGTVAIGLPRADVCGTGSLVSGTGILSITGVTLSPGSACTFNVDLLLPLDTSQGSFLNITSPLTYSGQEVAIPATAILEVDNDPDKDSILDQNDNCPNIWNPDQANNDKDSQGDVCDLDDDNDIVADIADNCPLTANPYQADFDGDGLGDACDLDDDNDGMPDTWEIFNGLKPYDPSDANQDDDGDGFTNLKEYRFGSDPTVFDMDLNNNGVPDLVDGRRGAIPSLWHLLHQK
ncbi:MAG: DUF11 domain-containing protein [Proteobacteria bacterium]|nr:DUF11 domain-containing protein [Pseudomonadota bacterium]